MKQYLLSALLCGIGVTMSAQEVCLDVDFVEGIPANFKLDCYDEMPVKKQDFKKVSVKDTWFIALVDSEDGVAAMSTSHRTYDLPTDNRMITPRLKLPAENVWLKWTARSIHYHLRDGYKVMVSTTGNGYDDFEEVASIAEEEYLWTKHLVSLEKYAGKEVYIAFVHDCQNKYLLAIDDIFVGQPAQAEFIVEDKTPRFVGDVGKVAVNGMVRNSGKVCADRLECVTQWGDTLKLVGDGVWMTGESYDYSFDVPVKVGSATHYKLELAGENGERHTMLEDSVICSYYPRKILLEKATGTWCINCPEMISYIQELEERYGDEIVCTEVHGPEGYGGDIWAYAPYYTGMKTPNLPTVLFNRHRDKPLYNSSAQSRRILESIVNRPTFAKIEAEASYKGADSVKASAKVTFATEVTGKFRVGFALIEKTAQTDKMLQINGASSLFHGEYYYLPTTVPADLMWYSNVVRSDNMAFNGLKNSLPAKIEVGVEYRVEASIYVPELVGDKSNLAVVAIVMNYNTDEVLNVDEVRVMEDANTVRPVVRENTSTDISVIWGEQKELKVISGSESAFTVELLSMDGRQVTCLRGKGCLSLPMEDVATPGVYLLRICQDNRMWTKKIFYSK